MKLKGLLTLTVSLLTATLAIALPTLDTELTGADKLVQTATMTGADGGPEPRPLSFECHNRFP
jgi:hypothetical protein